MTHPFHPLLGQEFDLVGYAHTWGEHRVFFREPGEERVRSLPAGWTDVEGPDPFLVLSGGRTCFRVDDLVGLARLLDELDGRCQGDSAVHVRPIMPTRDGRR
ncbi:MAG: DUF5372 family protein [Candidatus Limnocylindrales bacterium]